MYTYVYIYVYLIGRKNWERKKPRSGSHLFFLISSQKQYQGISSKEDVKKFNLLTANVVYDDVILSLITPLKNVRKLF